MITQGQLRKDFMDLGIKAGDHIALGISFGSVGMVSGGPKSFVDALVDLVGPGGTIMIPTFTNSYRLSLAKYHKVPVFSKKETVSYTGIIAEHIRNDLRAIRSGHPTNSFAAIGGNADYLLRDHDHHSSSYSPYSKLADINGKVLIIGLNYNFVGIRHEAQSKAGLLNCIPPYKGALFFDEGDSIGTFIRRDPGGCTKRLPYMIDNLREAGIVTEGSVGKAKAILIPARESLDIMTNLLKRNPEHYLCESPWCLWCREIERRLKLCDKVSDKKWFHRNSFLRFPLDAYNYLRVRDIAAITLVIYLIRNVGRTMISWLPMKQKTKKRRLRKYAE